MDWKHPIAVISPDAAFAFGLRVHLEAEGYAPDIFPDPTFCASARLAVVDVPRVGPDILGQIGRLRAQNRDAGILVITPQNTRSDHARLYAAGANAVLLKPFDTAEFTARIRALHQRQAAEAEADAIMVGRASVLPGARIIRIGVAEEAIAPKAFDLLIELIRNAGHAISREHLLRSVWGYQGFIDTRTVDQHIVKIRRVIEPDPLHPSHIMTVRKFGYRLRF